MATQLGMMAGYAKTEAIKILAVVGATYHSFLPINYIELSTRGSGNICKASPADGHLFLLETTA